MERICSRCHAVIAIAAERCPACGGEVVAKPAIPASSPSGSALELDHRGIVLPARHALGGIITPQ